MVACGLALLARQAPLISQRQLLQAAVLLTVLSGIVGALFGWFKRIEQTLLAQWLDRKLGLAERLSTALEFAKQPATALTTAQFQDTLTALDAIDLKTQLPIRLGKAHLSAVVVASVLLGSLLYAPNPQFETVAQNAQVTAEIEDAVAELTALTQAVEDVPNLTEEQQAELTEPLQAAIEQLQTQALSPEQAAATIDAAAQTLEQAANTPALQQETQALQNVGAQLAESEALQDAAEALQAGDLTEAAEALSTADLNALTPAELEQLASSLDAAALNSATGELAESLAEAATAARNGDAQAAEDALAAAGESVGETQANAEQTEALAEAAQQANQAAQEVAQAGQPAAGEGQGANQGAAQPGNGGATGAAGQPGAGDSGSGEDGAGSGSGSGTSDGSDAAGGAASNASSSQNNSGSGGEREYEPIFAPQRIGGNVGIDVELESQTDGSGGDEILAETRSQPDSNEASLVPYNEVFGDYSQAAGQAIDNGDVPVGLRGVVRDYFTLLEP